MQRLLGRYTDHLYAVLRIVVGLTFACHGAQKLFGFLGGNAMPLVSQMGLAGIIEFFGGILIATGLFASYAAFVASGELAVAFFTMHFPRGFWPIKNGGELAVVYCLLFLYIAARGAGCWSLDALIRPTRVGQKSVGTQPKRQEIS